MSITEDYMGEKGGEDELEEKLYIRFERDKKSEVIKTLDFPINEKSKEKYQEILT